MVEKKAELDLDEDENAEGEGENDDPPFEPTEEDNIEMDGEPESAQLDDEGTNGFKVNWKSKNSGQNTAYLLSFV